ncbi:MAG: aldehyde dehydrogenase family protein, partial [Nitrospira sp.]|nr:aldehyde dehydrogenase family protein [Nitrospira sp.]
GYGETAGAAVTKHHLVNKVAFTGGVETGKLVAKNAANHLARVSLELGGKSPNIVFPDANLENAVNGIIAGIFAASGQTCIAGSRVFLHEKIYPEVLNRLVEKAEKIKMGDPSLMETEMGPIALKEQLDKIKKYVEIGLQEGARLVCGGEQPTDPELRKGWFFKPTIFANVHNQMRIAQEEIFGPVLGILSFREEEEVIQLANDIPYGLGAGVWTQDIQRAHRVAREIQAGTVWINTYRNVSFASPFGGYKQSGYGRENGFEVMKEYTQVKSVWVELSGTVPDPFVMR